MILKEKIYINTSELGFRISELTEAFTYKNPEIYQKKKLKLSIKGVPPNLFHYKISDYKGNKVLELPRGGLEKVRDFYAQYKLPFRLLDYRVTHPKIDVTLTATTLETQQHEIIDVLLKNEGGLIEMSPGAGKSIAVLGLISSIKQPTLIIVHEHRLSSQWMIEIKKRLAGNFILGKYDGDAKEDGDIVVGIINSVYLKYKEDPTFFDKFGMVVIDECHHLPAHTFLSVVNNIPAKYRIGVTGTVKRKDQKEILIYDVIGNLLKKIDDAELKHRITSFKYKIVDTGVPILLPKIKRWTGKKKENVLDMAASLTELIENDKRNDIIVREAIDCIESGYFPLVLSSRVAHNELLYKRLCDLGYKVVLLIGKTRKKTNWEDIRNDGTLQCIIANDKIAAEGLDLPRLSALLLTCPSSNLPKLKQKVGRIRRVFPGKLEPIVVDFRDDLAYTVDENTGEKVTILKYSANRRVKYYKELIMEYNGL